MERGGGELGRVETIRLTKIGVEGRSRDGKYQIGGRAFKDGQGKSSEVSLG